MMLCDWYVYIYIQLSSNLAGRRLRLAKLGGLQSWVCDALSGAQIPGTYDWCIGVCWMLFCTCGDGLLYSPNDSVFSLVGLTFNPSTHLRRVKTCRVPQTQVKLTWVRHLSSWESLGCNIQFNNREVKNVHMTRYIDFESPLYIWGRIEGRPELSWFGPIGLLSFI